MSENITPTRIQPSREGKPTRTSTPIPKARSIESKPKRKFVEVNSPEIPDSKCRQLANSPPTPHPQAQHQQLEKCILSEKVEEDRAIGKLLFSGISPDSSFTGFNESAVQLSQEKIGEFDPRINKVSQTELDCRLEESEDRLSPISSTVSSSSGEDLVELE